MSQDRPLVVCADETIFDEIVRIAAVAGCAVERAPDLIAARARLDDASLLLIDERSLTAQVRLPRRCDIVLVTSGTPPPSIWELAFAVGVTKVLSLPADESALLEVVAEAIHRRYGSDGCLIAVVGGCGGAGASVLAAATGLAAAQLGPALLADCDPSGGGIHLLFGAERDHVPRWSAIGLTDDDDRAGMAPVFLAPHSDSRPSGLMVISCDDSGQGPTMGKINGVLATLRAGHTVVCDLPRWPTDASVIALAQASLVVLVVPGEVRASAAAKAIMSGLGEVTNRIGLVVRDSEPERLPARQLAAAVGVPLLARMPAEPRLRKRLACGEFAPKARGPLMSVGRFIVQTAYAQAKIGRVDDR